MDVESIRRDDVMRIANAVITESLVFITTPRVGLLVSPLLIYREAPKPAMFRGIFVWVNPFGCLCFVF